MALEKWRHKREVRDIETRISQTKDAKMREILELLPSGITFKQLKFAFIDKVVKANGGNLTAASREMEVAYRTILSWVNEDDRTTVESRGRKGAFIESLEKRGLR